MKVIESDLAEVTCFGCKHLEVKDIWRGMHTASCDKDGEGLIVPHEWAGNIVIIRGVGDFCSGKET